MTNVNSSLTVPATDISAEKVKAYLCALSADQIFSVAEVLRRKEHRKQGFQRNLSTKRVRDIVAYLSNPRAIIANNVVIGFDQDLSFSAGELILPTDEDKRGWVIDGQHRLAGIQEAKWKYRIAAVIVSGSTIQDMASLFRTINSTQKGVPASSCRR